MKNIITASCLLLAAWSGLQVAVADDDFYGIVQRRPAGKVGTWIIGGRSFDVTSDTELDEDDGPLRVGVCAEVDIDDDRVDEIESEPATKCRR
jgi:hypothetical protein